MKNIHMCRQVKRTQMQITVDEDLNVPDIRPDVELIIQNQNRIVLEHTRIEKGKLYLEGNLEVAILYMDDTKERQVFRLDTKLPFEEIMNMEGVEPGDNVRIRCETEDLNVTLINSRKLAIRGLLCFEASVEEIYDLSAAVETQTKLCTCERQKKLELMQLEVQKKDILRLKEESTLPPNKPDIQEIIWDNVQLRNVRTKLQEGRLAVQGTLFCFVLYSAADEARSRQWLEMMLPFEGELECSGCSPELVPDLEISLAQTEVSAKEDTDGEMRILHIEGVLDLEIRLYGREEAEILEDIYSPEKSLELTVSEEVYESLVMRNESRCKAGGRIRIQSAKPRILQICHSNGSVKIDQTEITEEGIRIEGALAVSILYISSDDAMPFAVLEGAVPFSHVAQVPGIDPSCRFTLNANLDQLSAVMADSEEIEVKACINLNLFIVRPQSQQCIHAIQEREYEQKELEAVPGITGYFVQEGESLWDIGKQYYMTPQQIMEMNALESDQIHPGDCLILMKCMNVLQHFS